MDATPVLASDPVPPAADARTTNGGVDERPASNDDSAELGCVVILGVVDVTGAALELGRVEIDGADDEGTGTVFDGGVDDTGVGDTGLDGDDGREETGTEDDAGTELDAVDEYDDGG